jgi:Tfp pilus assembly protein PilF
MPSSLSGLLPSLVLTFTAEMIAEPPTGTAMRLLAEARSYLEADKPELARAKLERLLKLDPSSAQAHYLLGTIREGTGELDAAGASYDEALRLVPEMA